MFRFEHSGRFIVPPQTALLSYGYATGLLTNQDTTKQWFKAEQRESRIYKALDHQKIGFKIVYCDSIFDENPGPRKCVSEKGSSL